MHTISLIFSALVLVGLPAFLVAGDSQHILEALVLSSMFWLVSVLFYVAGKIIVD